MASAAVSFLRVDDITPDRVAKVWYPESAVVRVCSSNAVEWSLKRAATVVSRKDLFAETVINRDFATQH
jgi:hypothetical protein